MRCAHHRPQLQQQQQQQQHPQQASTQAALPVRFCPVRACPVQACPIRACPSFIFFHGSKFGWGGRAPRRCCHERRTHAHGRSTHTQSCCSRSSRQPQQQPHSSSTRNTRHAWSKKIPWARGADVFSQGGYPPGTCRCLLSGGADVFSQGGVPTSSRTVPNLLPIGNWRGTHKRWSSALNSGVRGRPQKSSAPPYCSPTRNALWGPWDQ